ncbi:hypothetical protein LPJ78_003365 [Coemansia sp. RSA 989]|nr:hypothetical protein LPJ78_003365 [Coemansia sp. RSA 989]KAJ2668944.1 hypothetical protein IWW42_004870 [Coemansia sp. RSA 1085]
MEYQEARETKLSFKGSKRKSTKREKKHKTKRKRDDNGAANKGDDSGWVPVSSMSDLEGPLAIYFQDECLYILTLCASALELQSLASEGTPMFVKVDSAQLADAEPSKVEQVFVGRKSIPANAPSEPNYLSFRSCKTTYLSADRSGQVTCSSVAIGSLEMWEPVLLPEKGKGAIALKITPPGSDKEQYLGIEANKNSLDSVAVNACSSSIESEQIFIANL